jgi:hypothetical protein
MADEHILKQLDHDSNVIGYQPDLEYKKPRTAVGEFIPGQDPDQTYDPDKDTTLYTKTLNGFAENLPSSVLADIDYVLKNIKRLKQKLAEKFKEEQALLDNPFYKGSTGLSDTEIILNNAKPGESYNPYNDITKLIDAGENGNTDFTQQFEDQYNDVTGTVIPALINQLNYIETKLSNLNVNFKDVYYGRPNISIPEAQGIDNAYVNNMRLMERDGTNGKINYLTISFDAILNKLVSFTVFQDNKSAIKCAKVIDSHEDAQATSNDMDILKEMFAEIEKELDIRSRGYMRNEDLELIQKSMYNYYEKRKHLNDVYNLYQSNPESKFLGRKVTEYTAKLNDAVKNVSRVLMYNQNYLNQITVLEKQKYNLQKLSRSTSSNS